MSKDNNIIYREKYGTSSKYDVYVNSDDILSRTNPPSPHYVSVLEYIKSFCREVFLPHGYPGSVSDDYLHYQVWDTIQAFFSTITGTLTTQAILKGVGVGSTTATAYSAAITWILKDGTGMAGKIVFAWWKGSQFDSDCKKWRLFADCLNDAAMCIELMLPYFMEYSTQVLCIATAMKSLVGVAGGATRAALTQHQAIRENMADVSAKDGSQETCVNLLASCIGILILATFDEGEYVWPLFAVFTICHLYANYRAVRALKMVTLNAARFTLLLKSYLVTEVVSSPKVINLHESVILGCGETVEQMCGFRIKLGVSLQETHLLATDEMKLLGRFYRHRDYLLCIDIEQRTLWVFLNEGATATDIIQAFYHAVLLGIALCILMDRPLVVTNRQRPKSNTCPMKRLRAALEAYSSSNPYQTTNNALIAMLAVEDTVNKEFPAFLASLNNKGWNTDSHHLAVDEWRADWSREQSDTELSHADSQEELSSPTAAHEHDQ